LQLSGRLMRLLGDGYAQPTGRGSTVHAQLPTRGSMVLSPWEIRHPELGLGHVGGIVQREAAVAIEVALKTRDGILSADAEIQPAQGNVHGIAERGIAVGI